jgi:hypothetical protein
LDFEGVQFPIQHVGHREHRFADFRDVEHRRFPEYRHAIADAAPQVSVSVAETQFEIRASDERRAAV